MDKECLVDRQRVHFEEFETKVALRAGMAQIVVAHAYGVKIGDMRANTRGIRQIALARHVAMYLTHIVFAISVRDVARIFRRDRSTCFHAIRRVEDMRDDPEINRLLGWLEATLRDLVEGES
jgi:chromosomal replication initiation ATPase DnaA